MRCWLRAETLFRPYVSQPPQLKGPNELLPLGEAGRGYMQLVTPRVVAIAVRMLMTSWMTNLMVSFFIAVKG